MKIKLSTIRNNYSGISKIFLLILSVVCIVSLFPKEGKFKYEFQKGKPWMHNDLIAPFDFAIIKSDYEVSLEKKQILKSIKPYFIFNQELTAKKRNEFLSNLDKEWKLKYSEDTKSNYDKDINFEFATKIIDSVFNIGIIKHHPEIENKSKNFTVIIVKNNVAKEIHLGDLFTVTTAVRFISKELNSNSKIDRTLLLQELRKAIVQNLVFDPIKTKTEKKDLINNISSTRGMVQKGERIISKGELVNLEKFQILESLKDDYEEQLGASSNYYAILIGQIILVSIAIFVFTMFLLFFRKDIYENTKKLILSLLLIIIMVILTSVVLRYNPDYLYLVPLCLAPIIIRAFFDTRLALFIHVITIIIISFLVPNSLEFVFLQLIAGIITIISVKSLQKRSQFFLTIVYIFLTYSIIHIGMTLIQDGKLENIDLLLFGLFAGSAILTFFAFPLIFVFEKIFGFITDVSLMEYSDTNNKLLRELATKAPGTFQHSIQVSNLAEEAILEIGGNALLARTGALYHDVGKSLIPMYFIENQSSGYNPHDELSYEESAKIIISHIIKGIELAKKHKLPEQIIDFIRTHHGTKRADYFYYMHKKSGDDELVDDKVFEYHGPIPFSKETSVVMMADAVEAASRSLKMPTEEKISELIDKIINKQFELEQFMNSDITLKEITKIKKIFKKKLLNIHHIRVEYPD